MYGLWIITCLSSKSVKESAHTTLSKAVNYFFTSRENMEYFDVVIPLSVPNPIKITKPIRKILVRDIKPKTNPIYEALKNMWENTH